MQRGLGRRIQQPAAITGWVIDELPLIVVVLLVELSNTLFFAGACDPKDRASAEGRA